MNCLYSFIFNISNKKKRKKNIYSIIWLLFSIKKKNSLCLYFFSLSLDYRWMLIGFLCIKSETAPEKKVTNNCNVIFFIVIIASFRLLISQNARERRKKTTYSIFFLLKNIYLKEAKKEMNKNKFCSIWLIH